MKSDPTFWILARASGIVAYGLLTCATLAGLVLKSRALAPRVKPASITDVHRFLALLSLGAVAVHGFALASDKTVAIDWLGLLVPGRIAYRPVWTGVGVVAAELTVLIYASFSLRKVIRVRNWRRLHWLTYLVFAGVTLHGRARGLRCGPAVDARRLSRRGRLGRLRHLVSRAHARREAAEGRRPPCARRRAASRARRGRGRGRAKLVCRVAPPFGKMPIPRANRHPTITGMRILLVEDEDSIAEPLADGLRREGFDVVRAATGAAALEAAPADLVLLDLRLPDLDGLDVCRRLRERSGVPIIVVTARGEEADRVVGLELGADDYVVKPFGLRELIARIRAVTRRTGARGAAGEPLRVGALEVDERARRATLDGRDLELTPKEFDLLAALARDPGAAVSRRRLLEEVWETTWYGSSKTIDVHVAALRRKLGDPGWIETVRGVGFRLRDA